MKIRLPLIVAFAFAAMSLTAAAKDHVYRKTSFVQPDGTELELRIIGNMFYARTETVDGHTVIYNTAENKYYYAQPSDSGESIVPSNFSVGAGRPLTLTEHLSLDADSRADIVAERKEKFDKHRAERWIKRVTNAKLRNQLENAGENVAGAGDGEAGGDPANFADVVGSKVGLTIIAEFPDIASPVSQAKIDRYCNEVGYTDDGNSGSVRDYFSDQSVGLLDYSMKVSTVVTLPNPRDYYNFEDYPANNSIRDMGVAGNMLIRDAVQVLKDENFNFDGLTLDENKVLSTNVLFAGDDSGVWARGLWPHQWGMQPDYPISVTVDGQARSISSYQITNVEDAAITIGTFIHESGHLLLDFPDLYDKGGRDSGALGNHALMCSGNYCDGGKTPAPINLHFKDVVGWADITEISSSDYVDVNLPSTGNVGYQITNPDNADEFFVFENRGDGDIWAKGVPDKGVLIWHVDSGVDGNDDEQMTPGSHYQISLEQADGLFDLELKTARGDANDAFDSNYEPFNDFSLPNSNWWSGQSSTIVVEFRSLPGSNMNAVFGGFAMVSPNGGERVSDTGPYEIRWAAGGDFDVKIDLFKGGAFHSTIVSSAENDGSYIWNLDGTLAEATDYTMLVTSLVDPTLYDASDTAFTIGPELTGGGGKIPNDWSVSSGANKGWVVTQEFVTEGQYSFKSSKVGDNQKCAIEYTGLMAAGFVSFDCKVSSEPQFDFFNFYIDGVKQTIDPNDGVELGYAYLGYVHKGRSGDRDWANFQFAVSAGKHTIKIEYKKDFSSSLEHYYGDAVWVDNIQLPAASSAPAPAFATWTEDHFGVNQNIMEIAGSEVDSDNDGIKNFAEYVFGLNPQQADQVKVEVQQEGNQLSLIYPKNTAATDVTYRVMESVSLTTGWAEAVVVEEILSTVGDVDVIKATVTVPDEHQRHFLKLNVE